tara:strand:- start:35 stop:1090 length:1056 start_codon:yes stop_codon:yes gene_type:complete
MVNSTIIEYVWIGGKGELRSKIKVINEYYTYNDICNNSKIKPYYLEKFKWNYDGSSTEQANGDDSEITLNPVRIFYNPDNYDYANSFILLCDTYCSNGEPAKYNNRKLAKEIFDKDLSQKPWFGLEQEYFLMDPYTRKPICFDDTTKQGQFYCSVGYNNAFGRDIAEEHLQKCITAGIKITGINAEVAPGQWEFQIGICEGIEAGDHMIVARYLLEKITEKYNAYVDFEPKPLEGDWNGSGCHTNYSTLNMREGCEDITGLEFIQEAIEKLSLKHDEHMAVYGTGNEKRMTGKHETASYDKFSHGVANRGASVRIGNETYKNQKGYFEDRRPSSNCDPYLVTSKIFETTCL